VQDLASKFRVAILMDEQLTCEYHGKRGKQLTWEYHGKQGKQLNSTREIASTQEE
jgi:hypothetical protein